MHHPGPPRFTSVGESVELAPRNPDSGTDFSWTITAAPEGSAVSLGDDPVEHLEPDEAGVYRLELDAPDGTHELTVRAFPDERRPVRFETDAEALADADRISVAGVFNEHRLGVARPEREGDAYVYETDLPPGEHEAAFVPDGDFNAAQRATEIVEGPDRPRVQVDTQFENGGVTIEAKPLSSPASAAEDGDLDVEFYVDDRDCDGLDGELSVVGATATAERSALPDRLRVHAVAVGERYSVPDCVEIHADGTVERPNDPPEWIRDATMYSAFTRSLTGEAEASFEEIERRVPYLEHLGIDALWLTPILHDHSAEQGHSMDYGGPHGYHTLDYFRVAPDMGSREDLESLIETCHDHGIYVLFDLVINHTSEHHPFFQLASAGVPEYEDYYAWEDESAGDPETYFAWSSIPNLNYDSLAVREHILDVVEEWAPLVDGYRCDVAWGVPNGFWQEVRERVKEYEAMDGGDFLMLAETIPRDPDDHALAFDLHYDTTLYETLGAVGRGEAPASDVLDAVESEAREGFPPHACQMRYIENHDESRYLKECDRAAQKAATAATFTLPGTPMLYYGQETGMLAFRGPMDWGGDDELTAFCRDLSLARDELAVLRRGSVEPLAWETERDDAVAFAREHEQRRVVVVLNFGPDAAEVTVPTGVGSTDLVTDERLPVDREGDTTTVTVDTVAVLEG
jgi:glycosidase